MTSTTQDASSLPRAQASAKPAPIAKATPAEGDGTWPAGLTIILFVIATLALNIGFVLYLASQMPR